MQISQHLLWYVQTHNAVIVVRPEAQHKYRAELWVGNDVHARGYAGCVENAVTKMQQNWEVLHLVKFLQERQEAEKQKAQEEPKMENAPGAPKGFFWP